MKTAQLLKTLTICFMFHHVLNITFISAQASRSSSSSTTVVTSTTYNMSVTTSPAELKQALCNNRSSCVGISNSLAATQPVTKAQFVLRNCFCDSPCSTYNDCCGDADSKTNLVTSLSLTEHVTLPMFSCEIYSSIDSLSRIYVISTCPSNYANDYVINSCRNYKQPRSEDFYRWPVSDAKTGYLYANVFCATCHGVTNVSYWQAAVTCVGRANHNLTQDSALSAVDLARSCTVRYQHPTFKPRYCRASINTCNQNGDDQVRSTLVSFVNKE